jgi:uncharacterized membrane protein
MTDDTMERIIGTVLRAGVLLSAAVVAAGGVWYVSTDSSATADYRHFHPGVGGVHALATLAAPQILILVGLLILIATPIARVAFSLVAFALEGDRLYVGVALVVLAALFYSIGTSWW